MCPNRWSVSRLPLVWNGKFGFDSESDQLKPLTLNFIFTLQWEEQTDKFTCCVVGKTRNWASLGKRRWENENVTLRCQISACNAFHFKLETNLMGS